MKQSSVSRPTFEQRMSQQAKEAEDLAWRLPPGQERDALLRKARQLDIACSVSEWLSTSSAHAAK
jgi:hypothetical protein